MFVCVCVRTSAVSTVKTLSSQRRRATFSDRRLPRSASSAVCSQIKDGIVLRTVAPCQVCFCSCFVCFGLVCVCLRTCVFLCAHSLCVDGARMCFCVRTLLCLSGHCKDVSLSSPRRVKTQIDCASAIRLLVSICAWLHFCLHVRVCVCVCLCAHCVFDSIIASIRHGTKLRN